MSHDRHTTYLDRILATHRVSALADERPLEAVVAEARAQPSPRGFRRAIVDATAVPGGDAPAVIAEVKRRSPSKGMLRPDLDPTGLARAYEAGGAACLSVLTDHEYFGGSTADLRAARGACSLPVLRKDFTVCALDVADARAMGADCVLLIAAALDDTELASFAALARDLGLDALFEVHDERELERALAAGADMVGVNQRDLVTFEVDTRRAVSLAPRIPEGIVRVAESGIRGAADAAVLAEAGFHAVLVGESLVTSDDPAGAVRALRQAP